MNDRIVDALARRAAEGLDRRGLLALITGAALASLASSENAAARKKKKKKSKKKKNSCKGRGQVGAQSQSCGNEDDKCGSKEEREAGKTAFAACKTRYNGYCDLIAEANDCMSTLVPCCHHHERCDRAKVSSCTDEAFAAYPELCDFVFISVCQGL